MIIITVKNNKNIKTHSFEIEGLDHEICMGIRKGLFGANAVNDDSIDNSISEIANSIDRFIEAQS